MAHISKTTEVNIGDISYTNPPSYASISDPPPSYGETIQKKIERARLENPNKLHFARKVCAICLATVGFTVILALSLALPISMIVVGSVHLDDCPAEDLIPKLLIASGCVWCLSVVLSLVKKRVNKEEENNEEVKTCTVGTFISWVNTILFIVGSVYVYKTRGFTTTHHDDNNYCDYNLYYFAFWMFTTFYIIAGLFSVCCCCVMVYAVVSSENN